MKEDKEMVAKELERIAKVNSGPPIKILKSEVGQAWMLKGLSHWELASGRYFDIEIQKTGKKTWRTFYTEDYDVLNTFLYWFNDPKGAELFTLVGWQECYEIGVRTAFVTCVR